MGADGGMLGAVAPAWCPFCRCPPGPDCANSSRGKRQVRRAEKRALAREVADVFATEAT